MLAVIRKESDMPKVLRERRRALRITQEEAEHQVGLTRGHIGKIEHGESMWGKKVMRMTFTLECLLEYYGLRIIVIDADDRRLEVLDRLGLEAAIAYVARRKLRGMRCPETIDLFRGVADAEIGDGACSGELDPVITQAPKSTDGPAT